MKNLKLLVRVIIGFSILSFLAFILFLVFDKTSLTGPALTVFFVFLAIGFQFSEKLRKYAYTIWIFAAVTVSMTYPQLFRQFGNFDLKKLIIPLLQIIMFGMGSQLSLKSFGDVMRMPAGVIVGIVCQFTIMPFVGFFIAKTFGFPPEIAAGIILIGCAPSGLASNVMSFIARANLALSVTLTTFTTLLAPLMTPLLMKLLAGQFVAVDFWDMMLDIPCDRLWKLNEKKYYYSGHCLYFYNRIKKPYQLLHSGRNPADNHASVFEGFQLVLHSACSRGSFF
jgi:BASS family bile acid:Na+ symporter